jgi:hypothetical protein
MLVVDASLTWGSRVTSRAATLSDRVTVTCVVVVPRWARLSLSLSCPRGAAVALPLGQNGAS